MTLCCGRRSSGTTSAPRAECAEIEERVGLGRLIELTGNRALAGFTAPKLLWLRRHEPEVYERIAHVLLPKDYVRFRLTGERAIDAADASGTLLFDVARRRWSDEVLELLELPRAWLPDAHESTEIGGAGDQAAGGPRGRDRPSRAACRSCSARPGVVFAALPAFAADPQARLHSFCHAVPDTWHAMGVMLSAAGSLRWLRDVLGAGYDALLADAAEWPPGTEGVLFAPYLAGERTPHADPDARGAFTGLALHHDRGALARAVLEGVAFGLRDSLELLAELGVEPTAARVSGGGARSELWLRIVASVLGLPLERTAVEEGAAFGAALLGGVSAGVFASAEEAVAACVRVRDTGGARPGLGRRLRGGVRPLPLALSRAEVRQALSARSSAARPSSSTGSPCETRTRSIGRSRSGRSAARIDVGDERSSSQESGQTRTPPGAPRRTSPATSAPCSGSHQSVSSISGSGNGSTPTGGASPAP